MINYYLLTKPGIIMGNLFTFAAGFLLASKEKFDFFLFFATLFGLAFIIASACILNNYLDREIDKKMNRTKERLFAKNKASVPIALFLAFFLGISGGAILLCFTNLLTASLAFLGFFIYVFLYTLWKAHTVYGTAIGSLAGAIPPVVGYCAVSNQIDAGALLLFGALVFWQMPHFFAIAIRFLDDYAAAKIPVLPLIKGLFQTKIHMALYVTAFVLTAASFTFFDYTGYVYLGLVATIGMIWLGYALQGFLVEFPQEIKKEKLLKEQDSETYKWATGMYKWSLIMIGIFCIAIPVDRFLI